MGPLILWGSFAAVILLSIYRPKLALKLAFRLGYFLPFLVLIGITTLGVFAGLDRPIMRWVSIPTLAGYLWMAYVTTGGDDS